MARNYLGILALTLLICANIAQIAQSAEKKASANQTESNVGMKEVPFEEGKAPPPGVAGKVWCLVTKPPVFKTETKQVLVRPATFYFEEVPAKYEYKEENVLVEPEKKVAVRVPAEYKTETIQQLIEPESFELKTIPAQYEWVTEEVVISPETEENVLIPAKYKTVTEQVLVEPERTELRRADCKTKGVLVTQGEKKDECYAYVVVPARYATVTKQVLAEEAKIEKRKVPAVTKQVKVRKLVKEATTEKVKISAKFATIEKKVLVAAEKIEEKVIPARHEVVKKLVEVAPAGKRKVEKPAEYETITVQTMTQPASMVWRLVSSDICKIVGDVVKKYGSVPGLANLSR